MQETLLGLPPSATQKNFRFSVLRVIDLINLNTISLRTACSIGTIGAFLLFIGSFGAGDRPTRGNPEYYLPILNTLRRMPTDSAATIYMGELLTTVSWLIIIKLNYDVRDKNFIITHVQQVEFARRYLSSLWFYMGLLFIWVFPRIFSYPLFSQDVYSYIAQGNMYLHWYDPYTLGPGNSLGPDSIFTASVPSVWWYTPSPYGPIFIWMASRIAAITGTNFLVGLFIYKIFSLISLLLMMIIGLHIVRQLHANPISYMLFGILNPVVLFNLIDSLHNDAWAITLALCAIDVYIYARKKVHLAAFSAKISLHNHLFIQSLILYGCAVILIVFGALIKMPVLGMALFLCLDYCAVVSQKFKHRSWSIKLGFLGIIALLSAILSLVCAMIIGRLTHLGLGWLHALNSGNSWSVLLHLVAELIDQLGQHLYFGNHVDTIENILIRVPIILFLVVTAYLSVQCYQGKINFIQAIGFTLLAASFLIITTFHTWYCLWWVPLLALWWPTKVLFPIFIGTCIWSSINHPGGHGLTSNITVHASIVGYSPLALFLCLVIYQYYRFHIAPKTRLNP